MHYKQIDGFRFFAVIAVIFHHIFVSEILDYFPFGLFGVNVFFVISGFLITEILLREKLNNIPYKQIFKTFFLRRTLRIFPLYYLYILICLILVPQITFEYINWLLSYSINFWITINNKLAFWYFTHLWSLGVEEQFYIFWPFLIIFIPLKRIKHFLVLLILFSVFLRISNTFFIENFKLFNYTMLFTSLDCFAAGALLAYLKTFELNKLINFLKNKYLIIIALVIFILNNKFGNIFSQEAFSRSLNAFIAFYLVGIASILEFKGIFKIVLENKIIMYFGKISYGIYIYHLLIWGLFGKYLFQLFESFNFNFITSDSLIFKFIMFIYISIITILVSSLSFEIFEKRVLSLRKYFVYQKQN